MVNQPVGIMGWNLLVWSDLTLGPLFKVKRGQLNLKVLITHLLLGWTYYFCFFRRPPSHLVSRHFRQQFLSYNNQIWHAGLLG